MQDESELKSAEEELWRGCGGHSETAHHLRQLLRDAIRETRAQAEQVWAVRRQHSEAALPRRAAAADANESQRERNRGDEGGHAPEAKPGKLCTGGGGCAGEDGGRAGRKRARGAGEQELGPPRAVGPTKATPQGDVCMEQQELSLLCPLSHRRIRHAVKGTECAHVQCFDKEAWIQSYSPSAAEGAGVRMAIKRCPICGAAVNGLKTDATFTRLLEEAPPHATVVTVDQQYTIVAQPHHAAGNSRARGSPEHMVVID
jgi:hypothetical protein